MQNPSPAHWSGANGFRHDCLGLWALKASRCSRRRWRCATSSNASCSRHASRSAWTCILVLALSTRVWFPYARTRKPFASLREVFALKTLLDATLPNHVYRVEPQSRSYTTHGDLWDHLHDRHQRARQSVYLPLTLEMGSWTWVRKNPRQAFSLLGGFNPSSPIVFDGRSVVTYRCSTSCTVPRQVPKSGSKVMSLRARPSNFGTATDTGKTDA